MGWFRRHLFTSSTPLKSTRESLAQPQRSQDSTATNTRDAETVQEFDLEDFYRYTSGRWLWNEKRQFSRRYVKFNLHGLLQVSAQALRARSCVDIQKLPEGNFSKVFLLTMDNGRQLIAKLPNPNAGRPHFTTASEVATMDYVRSVLDIPAPMVYGYSSSTDNPVEAEYILMERCEGVELGKVWDDLSWRNRLNIVKTLVGYEKAFASASLPMYGSLYYAKDLPSPSAAQYLDHTGTGDRTEAFVVGPTTNRTFFDQGRDSVEVNRGPWPSLDEFVQSRAERELACIEKFSSYPGQQGLFNGPNQYVPSKAMKIKVLQDYQKVASQILPKDGNLSKPTLWHSDLHTDNIFVDPSQPTKIQNIIDWQAVNASALFLQARHPSLTEFEGPIPEGFDPIEIPDLDKMTEEEQKKAKDLRAAQSVYKLYEIYMLKQCPEIAHALRFRESLHGQITGLSSSIFSDGEPILQGMLVRLLEEWDKSVGSSVPCPLSFTPEDRAEQQRLEARWSEGVELMAEVLDEIGAYQGWDGWVNHNNYPIYKERLAKCRESFLSRHAETAEERSQWERAWPFEDKTESPTYP